MKKDLELYIDGGEKDRTEAYNMYLALKDSPDLDSDELEFVLDYYDTIYCYTPDNGGPVNKAWVLTPIGWQSCSDDLFYANENELYYMTKERVIDEIKSMIKENFFYEFIDLKDVIPTDKR